MKSILIFCLLSKAVAFDVVANGDTTSVYGGDASFSCSLADPTGVRQVTWQRLYEDNFVQNLATFSKRFGRQIIDPHQGRVSFTKASFNSTSIIVKNVTWEDEACYICSFNVYPGGSRRKQTCLTIEGISEVTTTKPQTASTPVTGVEVLVSCSATGKPTPVITWAISANVTSKQNNRTVLNDHQTANTTTSNLTLALWSHSGAYVDCFVNAGKRGERRERILLPITSEGQKEVKHDDSWAPVVITSAVILSIVLSVSICVALKNTVWTRFSRWQTSSTGNCSEMDDLSHSQNTPIHLSVAESCFECFSTT